MSDLKKRWWLLGGTLAVAFRGQTKERSRGLFPAVTGDSPFCFPPSLAQRNR